MKRRTFRRLAGLAWAFSALAGCGQDLTVTPVRNLERPTDLDFVCMAVTAASDGSGMEVVSGRPMSQCHDNKGAKVPGANRSYALFTNTARSEVGVIDTFDERLIDLDPQVPGYSMVPVGSLAEVLSVSDDGCKTVTANRGSCDLAVLDNSRLLAKAAAGLPPSTGPGEVVTRLPVRTGDGRLLGAAPAEIVFVPGAAQATPAPATEPGDGGPGDGAGDGGALPDAAGNETGASADGGAVDAGAAADATTAPDLAPGDAMEGDGVTPAPPVCGATPAGGGGRPWRAVVSFPGCDLVALVDLDSGRIVSSLRVLADGTLQDLGTSPSCPQECAGEAPGGAGDGGAGPGSLGVTALTVLPERNRVYIGALRSPVVSSVDVGATGFVRLPNDGRVALAEGAVGVNRLRLSRHPYRRRSREGMPNAIENSSFVGRRGDFLYAFARDGSVRVVQLAVGTEALRECDVNAEPDSDTVGCAPLGTPGRNLLARGPGLRLPALDPLVGPPTAVDIAFTENGDRATGFLLASNGEIMQVGLGPSSVVMDTSNERTHAFRSALSSAPNTPETPGRSFTDTGVAFPTKVAFESEEVGPRLEGYDAPNLDTQQYLFFPRPANVRPGRPALQLLWEGVLPSTSRTTGRLEAGGAGGASAGVLRDVGADFCSAGVQPGDVVSMAGCSEDRECPIDDDQICFRAAPGAQGTCLPRRLVNDEAFGRACTTELASRRRYEVREVSRTRVVLGLKLDEVPRPAVAPCRPDSQEPADVLVCQPDALHRTNPSIPGDPGFACTTAVGGRPRCLKACARPDPSGQLQPSDDLCRSGHVCADVGAGQFFCVEGPTPRPECSPGEARYQVQAGQSYLVASSGLPIYSRMKEAAPPPGTPPDPRGGACEVNTALNPLFNSRISLNAPLCSDLGDVSTAGLLQNFDLGTRATQGFPCLVPGEGGHFRAVYENPAARLVLADVDAYVGDAAAIRVTIDGGFIPLEVVPSLQTASVGLGVRILSGPMQAQREGTGEEFAPPSYLFLVDQGRTTSLLSRGKILRINPRPLSSAPGGITDSTRTGSLFPIQ